MNCAIGSLLAAAIVATTVTAAPPAVRAVIPGCCNSFGSMTVMQAPSGAIVRSLKTGPEGNYEVTGVGFELTKGGAGAVVLSYTSTATAIAYVLTVVNLGTGVITGPLTIPGDAESIAVNPRSGVIYITYEQSGARLEAIDPANLAVIADTAVNGAQGSIAVAPDGLKIFLSSANGVEVLGAADLTPIGIVALPGPATVLAVSTDSKTLYAAYGADSVAVADIQDLQVTHTISGGALSDLSAMAVSADGSQLYVAANTSISTVQTGTLSISTVALPIGPETMAVAPEGPIYLGQTTSGYPLVVVFDPASQLIAETYPAPGTGFLAIGADGRQLYHLAHGSAPISITDTVPSLNIAGSGITGASPRVGAYDARDNLLLVPDYLGNVNVIDPDSMQLKGLVTFSAPVGFVVFGNAGYALTAGSFTGIGSNTAIVRFDPVSLKITGKVPIPFPASDNSGYYKQPAADERFVYVPFNFYYAESSGSRPASGGVDYGIAVLDTRKMSLSIWPYDVSNILGFTIAPGTGRGYLSVGEGFDGYGLLEIDLRNGRVQRGVSLPVAGSLESSPDGSTIYLAAQFASGNGYGALYSIDRQTLAIGSSTPSLYLEDLTRTPDGQYLYGPTGTGTGGAVSIVSTASLQLVGQIPSVAVPSHVIFIDR